MHTLPTFKVCLVLREENCAAGKGMFLEGPTAGAGRSLQHMAVEVVDLVTEIQQRSIIFLRWEVYVVSRASWLQESVRLANGTAGGKNIVYRTENLFYTLGFRDRVSVWSLYYADRIDP